MLLVNITAFIMSYSNRQNALFTPRFEVQISRRGAVFARPGMGQSRPQGEKNWLRQFCP